MSNCGLSFVILSLFWILAVSGVCWAAFGEDIESRSRSSPARTKRWPPSSSPRQDQQHPDRVSSLWGQAPRRRGRGFDSVRTRPWTSRISAPRSSAVKVVELPLAGSKISMGLSISPVDPALGGDPEPEGMLGERLRPRASKDPVAYRNWPCRQRRRPLRQRRKINGEIMLIAGPKDSFWAMPWHALHPFLRDFSRAGMLQAACSWPARFPEIGKRPKASKLYRSWRRSRKSRRRFVEVIEPEAATAIGVALHCISRPCGHRPP